MLYFLKELVDKFKEDENGISAEKLKIKIEWLEDFIIFDNKEIKEIYQIKKTLTKKNREEVLNNFIIQYKIMNNKTIKWILGYDSTDLTDLSIEETEFKKIYTNKIVYEEKIQKCKNLYIKSKKLEKVLNT